MTSTTATGSSIDLAQRVQQLKPSGTLAVVARIAELKAAGHDVIGFGAGEPDFDTPAPIKQAAIDALNAGATKYAPVPGTPVVREAIAAKLHRENQIDCTPENVLVTVGGKHAIYLGLQCLIDPREKHEVILPTPAWVSYRPMAELAGARIVEVPGSLERDFKLTPEQLEQAITPRSRVLILNSPSNPCGTMYSPDELRALAQVIEAHPQLIVVSDEIYEKLIYGGMAHFSIGSVDDIADRVITINGLSKAYAMTGWRIGYAAAPGPIAKAMIKLQGQMTSGITTFNLATIPVALEQCAAEVEAMRCAFAHRAGLMHELISAMPGLRAPKPTGAFYIFPDMRELVGQRTPGGRRIESGQDFAAALLDEAMVAVVPGADFGECAAMNFRLSFAMSEAQLTEGCRRMHEWIERLA